MKLKKILLSTLIFFVPLVGAFFSIHAIIQADSVDEPYSIIVVAGQSWAEGTNSFRSELPAGTGVDKLNHPADTETGLWWAGADGKGPQDIFEFLELFYNGQSPAGWIQSGGTNATGAARLKDLNDTQRSGFFGPELGAARELYNKGRRKVIVLKVSYGFQALAKSNSPMVPFDWNSEPGRNKSYDRLKTEFNALTTYLKSIDQKYTVDGFYWLQGGTDALQNEWTAQYEENFTNLTDAVRTDLQLHPASQIVAVKMSMKYCLEESYPTTIYSYCGFPYAQSIEPLVAGPLDGTHAVNASRARSVRRALQTVADSDQNKNPKVSVVEVSDISMAFDKIHYDEPGTIEVGRRLVNMYKLPLRFNGSSDYDTDGVANSLEDTGRRADCELVVNNAVITTADNGNLGDDDSDCDGYPNYLDRIDGLGSGLAQ